MNEVTKESVAEVLGRPVDQITDEDVAIVKAEIGNEFPEQTTEPSASPATETDEDPVFKLSELKAKDILAEDHPLKDVIAEALKDPLRNERHPNHGIVAENQKTARQALEAKAAAEAEANNLKATLAGILERDKGLNDPEKGIYGGHTEQDVEDGTITTLQYLRDKETFEKAMVASRNIAQDRSQQLQSMWSGIDRETGALKSKHSDADVDGLLKRFVPFDREGKPNPDYRPLTVEEGHFVHLMQSKGGLDKLREQYIEEGKTLGRTEVLQKISGKSGKPLTNEGGSPVKTILNSPIPKTAQELESLPEEQQIKVADEILGVTPTYRPMFAFN